METHYKFCDRSFTLLICILVLVACALPAFAQAAKSTTNIPPPKWPVEFNSDGNRLIIYQPQIRDWQKFHDLIFDTAVSVTPAGNKPVLGVVSWHATTLTDTQARIVVIKDIVITSTRFPSLDAVDAAAMERRIRQIYLANSMTISLDRMLAGFKSSQAPPHVAVSTQPPPIFVSTKPAILLFVDGDPLRVPIADTTLGYVVNTSWDLLYDQSDYDLLNQTTWL